MTPAKGRQPDNYDPWRRLLAALLLRGIRDTRSKRYAQDANSFLKSPWVISWLKDEFGICLD